MHDAWWGRWHPLNVWDVVSVKMVHGLCEWIIIQSRGTAGTPVNHADEIDGLDMHITLQMLVRCVIMRRDIWLFVFGTVKCQPEGSGVTACLGNVQIQHFHLRSFGENDHRLDTT